MELYGYIAAALIGTSLGLLGAGGSILTVPLLVYCFHVPVMLASCYSLGIVGCTSLLGAGIKYRQGHIDFKIAVLFGVVSMTVVSIVRQFLIPVIPNTLFSINTLDVGSAVFNMILFSLLMVVTAFRMIKKDKCRQDAARKKNIGIATILSTSIAVGLVTGLLGAGGGFLIVPALFLFFHLPMQHAVGTSLLIVGFNSLTGFAVDLAHFRIDWTLLLTIAGISVAGIVIGISLSRRISSTTLKKTLGWIILLLGTAILYKEITALVLQNATHYTTQIHKK